MLSLNEIRNVHFRKTNFSGYKPEDVEAFIDEVQESYDQLLKENAELQKKVDVLAGKLEEYQHEEDAIRSALMNAQKLGDASLRDAKHKSEIILKDATIKAEKIVANAQTEIKREKEIVDRMQKDVADFKTNLLKLYKEHLMLINNIRSEDVLRPQTREYSNAVHIIETPFADDGYNMPNMTDMPVQPMNDTPYMGGGMPVNPMAANGGQPDMQGFAQPVSAPVSERPADFDMVIKKESSVSASNQQFAQDFNMGAENNSYFGASATDGQGFPQGGVDGGFSVTLPEEPALSEPNGEMQSAMPMTEAPIFKDVPEEVQNNAKGGFGFLKKRKK